MGVATCAPPSRAPSRHRPRGLRSILDGRIRFALAAFEVERTDHHVVLYAPVGAPGRDRDGLRDGPRGSFLRPENFEATWSPVEGRGAVPAVRRSGTMLGMPSSAAAVIGPTLIVWVA